MSWYGDRQKRVNMETLESEIMNIIKELGEASLQDLRIALEKRGIKASSETIRKTVERLMLKGVIVRTRRGNYAKGKTLDDYFKEEEIKIEIPHMLKKMGITYGKTLIEYVLKVLKDIELFDVKKISEKLKEEHIIGGATGDESSRPLRVYARMHTGAIIATYARLRIGGTLPFETILKGSENIQYEFENIYYIPDYISRGGPSIEVLVRRLKPKVLETNEIYKKFVGIPIDLLEKIIEKLNEYDIIDLQLDVAFATLHRAELKLHSLDYSLALIDGPLFPGHLDPHIVPCKNYHRCPELIEELSRDYPDVAEELLKRKRDIILRYWHLYQEAKSRENLVLIGSIKNSRDETLQRASGEYYGISDQKLLALGGLNEGEVLGPIKKHRLKEWIEQVEAMELHTKIPVEEPPIETYYIMKSYGGVPACFDIIFPEAMNIEEKRKVLYVLYQMLIEDSKHTHLSEEPKLTIYTPQPIVVIDNMLEEKSKEIANMLKLEIEHTLVDLLIQVAELATKFSSDVMIYIYNSITRSLRRLK